MPLISLSENDMSHRAEGSRESDPGLISRRPASIWSFAILEFLLHGGC